MLRLLRRALMVAVLCMVAAGLCYPQTLCTFTGRVIGVDGNPLKDALIKIDRKDIRGHWQVKTNKKGEWLYAGMPFPGEFKVTVEVDGKVADTMDNVRSKLSEVVELNFDLKKTAERSDALNKAAEAGTLSKEQAREMSPEQKAALEKSMKERQASMAKNKALQEAFNNAMTALNAKDFKTAIDGFNKAAELDPKQIAVWSNMATAYDGMSKETTGPEQDAAFAKAAETYKKVLEMKPDDASVHNNYALLLVRMKNIDGAKLEIAQAVQYDPPGAGKYYFNLGAIMVNNNQPDAAIEGFQKAVAADPAYANAWYQLGTLLSGKMTMDKDGTMIPPPGMKEALEKYLALAPTGQFADAAKSLLSVITTKIETTYQNPDAPKSKKKK
jgi:tetratricopeptide (TPR) repeat protein